MGAFRRRGGGRLPSLGQRGPRRGSSSRLAQGVIFKEARPTPRLDPTALIRFWIRVPLRPKRQVGRGSTTRGGRPDRVRRAGRVPSVVHASRPLCLCLGCWDRPVSFVTPPFSCRLVPIPFSVPSVRVVPRLLKACVHLGECRARALVA